MIGKFSAMNRARRRVNGGERSRLSRHGVPGGRFSGSCQANFWAYSDVVADDTSLIRAPYTTSKVYYNGCPIIYPQCNVPYPPYPTAASVRSGIAGAINQGSLIVNYVGHAAYPFWGMIPYTASTKLTVCRIRRTR